ncbi:MAG: GTP 3',8-cyclase MoaA [Bacteroidia bacterium]|nr:GTP 3',8-cyclase MoaA [Bacteroidia bacterium]
MLSDSFNRPHDYLRISLTDKCNLRCTYCMPAGGLEKVLHSSSRMSAEEIEKLATLFVSLGVKKIRLTGGEPLVRKDAKEIIRRLSALPVTLTLTTNGVNADEFIAVFKEAGIRSVNLSLDSLNPETFRRITHRDEFERVHANILLLLQEQFHVKVNVVLMKSVNDKEIPGFIGWTRDLPLHIRFIEYMPFKDNGWSHEQVVSSDEILEVAGRHFSFSKLNDQAHDTARSFKVEGFAGTFAIISTMTHPFCGSCNRLRLTADGKMKNCLFSKGEVDLLSALRNGDDLESLIRLCVLDKKAERGGQMSGSLEEIDAGKMVNRSMLAIGG